MELQKINNTDITVKEYNGQRVVTFKDIDAVHGRPDGTASRNFRTNRERFVEGEDFYTLNQPDEIRRFGLERPQGGTPDSVILITESGYLMLVKSFTDDLAWKVQRELIKGYFRAKEAAQLSPAEQLLAQAQFLVEQERRLKALEASSAETFAENGYRPGCAGYHGRIVHNGGELAITAEPQRPCILYADGIRLP